ncbi:MAG: hypothetical protein KGH69_04690 [Candidatus Micrarchaeota archaeon]|nr:hypothetical protein [Candidatus Micrarchaeota archaeon]
MAHKSPLEAIQAQVTGDIYDLVNAVRRNRIKAGAKQRTLNSAKLGPARLRRRIEEIAEHRDAAYVGLVFAAANLKTMARFTDPDSAPGAIETLERFSERLRKIAVVQLERADTAREQLDLSEGPINRQLMDSFLKDILGER